MGFGIILQTEYVDSDGSDLRVIYMTGKYNHGGGSQKLYSSETGHFAAKIKYIGPFEFRIIYHIMIC